LYINCLPIHLILIVSAALLAPCSVMAAADLHLNTSNILELNDSAVNSTLAVYPFYILDYYEPAGCNLCQRMNFTLSELSFELSGPAVIGKINSKDSRRTAETYNITSSPMRLIFKNGTLVETEVGYGSKSGIVDNLPRLKPDMNTRRVTSGRSKFSNSQGGILLVKLGVNNPGLPMPVTDETLANALEKYPFFVLMSFADWCGYCQMMNSTILELSEELKGRVAFGLIDAEKNNETAQKYNLVSYPRLLIFRNGTLISTQTGYKNTSQFSSILEGLEPTLNISLVNASMPSVAPQKPGSIIELSGEQISKNDTTLRYLDRILEAVEINRTLGNTINVFIINANESMLQIQ